MTQETSNKKTSTKKNKAFKSFWVWAVFGLFGIVFTVNYGFVSVALDTSPGLVTEKYYKYGLQQNKFDKEYRAQEARGWNISLILDEEQLHAAQPSVIQLIAQDKQGKPLSGGHAEITAYRPSDAKADVVIALKETEKPGIYQATMSLPIQGLWDMNLLFNHEGQVHMMNKRIVLQGNGETKLGTLEKIVKFITP